MRAVVTGCSIRATENRVRGRSSAVHRLCDAFTLERIHEARRVPDQEDTIVGRHRADESHLEPRAQRLVQRSLGCTSVENADAVRVLEKVVEVACGASAGGSIGEHADTETDIDASVASGKHPAVPREGMASSRRPEHDVREVDRLLTVGANREAPEQLCWIHESRDFSDTACRTVGTDDRVGSQPRRRRQYETVEPIIDAYWLIGAAVIELRASCDGGLLQRRVEP